MVQDLELVAGAYGPDEGFTITLLDAEGNPDDLTAFDTVRLVISDMLFTSPPTRNHTDSDAELAVDVDGQMKYIPTATNPVPAAGRYYVQIFRFATGPPELNIPAMKFSLLITRGVPVA